MSESKDKPKKFFEPPFFERLEDVDVEKKQCVTFRMPKRSCKALPSGISKDKTHIQEK